MLYKSQYNPYSGLKVSDSGLNVSEPIMYYIFYMNIHIIYDML